MNEDTPSEQSSTNNTVTNTNPPSVKSKKPIVLMLVIIELVVLGGLVAWALQQNSKLSQTNTRISELGYDNNKLKHEVEAGQAELEKRKDTTGEANIDKSAYQSVFLKGGQVYFGKITSISETQIVLEDIYYLRNNSGGTGVASSISGDISLVKLGNELHGPQDKMFIERKEVEFWENLKNDGQVAKAIDEYKKANP